MVAFAAAMVTGESERLAPTERVRRRARDPNTRVWQSLDSDIIGEEARMENVLTQHITKTSGVCGGRACIAGHRVRVIDVVAWHEMRGMSPDQIVDLFPGITLADVHAALAYYFDHRQEIENDFRNDDQWAERVRSAVASKIPPELREKVGG
jgi:uncharacterized protein (DUF433 family)